MRKDLYIAAESDNVTELDNNLLRENVLSELSHGENSVLHIAAYHGSRNLVGRLLRMIRQVDLEGYSYLYKRNAQGNSALHEAASGGHVEIVDMLLREDSRLASLTNKAGETAVFKASVAGHAEIIKMFETLPVEMYARMSDGQTSLLSAVFNKNTAVIKTLLDVKPELLYMADDLGRTPLHVAALIPPSKERVILPFHPWRHAIHARTNSHIANMLLENDRDGSLCHKLDSKNRTPLQIAVKEGNAGMVELILKRRKDCIEQLDNEGRNVVHLAVINAELIFERNSGAMKPMLHSLVRTGKRLINDRDNKGKTALDIAIDNIDKDEPLFSSIIKVLESNGATRNVNLVVEAEFKKMETSKSRWKTEIISLNAVLIGTVAFAAPFGLLGVNDFQSHPMHKERLFYNSLFYLFMIFDTLALVTSVASTILLLEAVFGKKEDSSMVQTSLWLLEAALISILVAFGSAIALALGPKYMWLIITLWLLLFAAALAIRKRTFRSKLFMSETRWLIFYIVEDTVELIAILFYDFFISNI